MGMSCMNSVISEQQTRRYKESKLLICFLFERGNAHIYPGVLNPYHGACSEALLDQKREQLVIPLAF